MTLEWWSAYLLTSIILSLSSGSGTINIMTTSLDHDYRGAVASTAGFQAGLAVHIVLIGMRLGMLFSRSVIAFEVLKWVGAAYLIWLGIQQWHAAGAIDFKSLASTQSHRHLLQCAILVNLASPESIVFLAALFLQFIMPQQPQPMQHIVLSVITIIVDAIVMIDYAIFVQRIILWIKGPRQIKALDKIFDSLFVLVGALLASARHA